MPTERECRCCKEVQRVAEKAMEEPETDCITDHQGFKTVCLDKDVLEVARYQYRQQYGHNAFEGPVDQKWRHIAYRQLARSASCSLHVQVAAFVLILYHQD
ncbi:hypothetical protein KUCAC02_037548 [Chaenocephalus aceratus]|nr:hypothetical protein KUCAC02_037548 [Chaenocephalus aceratus]